MSVSPLGNINFINQNSPVVSHTASTQQARFDMQSAMASDLSAAKEREIEEVRPAEETYMIDPEHEHERQKNETEQESKDESEKIEQEVQEMSKNDESDEQIHHLDIKI